MAQPSPQDDLVQPTKQLSGFEKGALGCFFFGLTIGLLYFGLCLYAWWGLRDQTQRKPLPQQSDWPIPVRELYTEMKAAGIDVSSAEVYLLRGIPGDWADEVIFRIPDTPETMEFLQAKMDLLPVPADRLDWMISSASRNAPPDWWPAQDLQPEYSASRRKLEGDEADQYFLARDPLSGMIFVHYYFNF